jgi:competence protein ComEA
MERLRQWIRNWLGFSRTEVNGFLILLPLMIFLIMSEPLYRLYLSTTPPRDFSAEAKRLDSLVANWNTSADTIPNDEIENRAREVSLFHFNPNKASISELKSLGFSDHLSRRIAHYREKGGVFRIKDDLMKIYGVDSTFYHQLFPYILLPEHPEKKEITQAITVARETKSDLEKFDLNKADTSTFKKVYGIGSALAGRIVKFRTRLGGFINQLQLYEVYGLDTTVVKRLAEISFIEKDFVPEKLDINASDEKLLSTHPYITKTLAKAIVAYRYQHGRFKDVNDLKQIIISNPRDAEKLLPYLSVKD